MSLEEISEYSNIKFSLLEKYLNMYFIEGECKPYLKTFDEWLHEKLRYQRAVEIYGKHIVEGDICGFKFDVNLVDSLR